MNQKEYKPSELLEILYKYMCMACQIGFKGFHPKQMVEMDAIFVKLKGHLDAKEATKKFLKNVDSYNVKK
jgi:hypothetical protein